MKRYGHSILFCFLITFSILPVQVLHSEDIPHEAISILLSVRGENLSEKTDFHVVIEETISINLLYEGFTLVEKRSKQEPVYIVEGTYTLREEEVALSLLLKRASDSTLIYKAQESFVLDLDLDTRISLAMKNLIEAIIREKETNPPDLPLLIEIADETKPAEEQIKPFKISASAAPFLTIGEANKYFSWGLKGDLHFEYRLQKPFGYIGMGLNGSYNYFKASGNEESTNNHLLSLSPELRIGTETSSLLGIYMKMGGGITLFLLKNTEGAILTSIMPNAFTGLGIEINPSPRLGFFLSVDYCMYFERSLFISGFSPSLGLILRY